MGVFKEQIYLFEDLQKKQEQIYPHALDRGIPIHNGRNTGIRVAAREAMQHLAGLLEKRTKLPFGFTWQYWVGIEYDEGYEFGYLIRVTWIKKPDVEYLSFDVKHDRRKE